jgi:hypothetical protein
VSEDPNALSNPAAMMQTNKKSDQKAANKFQIHFMKGKMTPARVPRSKSFSKDTRLMTVHNRVFMSAANMQFKDS